MYMYQNTGAVSHNNNVNQSMYTLHSTIKARQCKTELQALANDEGQKNEGGNKIPLVCTWIIQVMWSLGKGDNLFPVKKSIIISSIAQICIAEFIF